VAVPGGRQTEDKKTVIAPGASQKVVLTVPTKYVRSREPYHKTVEVETNDPDKPVVRITLQFTVKDILVVRPDPVAFGKVRVGSENSKPLTITNKTKDAITIRKVSVFPGHALNVSPNADVRVDPGKTVTVQVTFRPPSPDRSFLGLVQIETDRENLGVKTVQVRASVTED